MGLKVRKKSLCGDFSQLITKPATPWLRRGKIQWLAVSLIRLGVANSFQWAGIMFKQLDQAAVLKTIWHTNVGQNYGQIREWITWTVFVFYN